MNRKPLWNKAIDYLIVCKDEDRATKMFERFCEFLDGTFTPHAYKALKDHRCVIMVGSTTEYRFVTEKDKDKFAIDFRKVVDEPYFETWFENYVQY